ncbi:MAG: VWA domain-containing protein [Chloroflexi bacterium]|nr:VWA domain-containing protein [Chloroflexota bacterium]
MKRLLPIALLALLLIPGLVIFIGGAAHEAEAQDNCPQPLVTPCPAGVVCPQPPIVICPPPTQPPLRGVFTNPDWLRIDYHRVNVQIENQIARTEVNMQFVNEGDGLAEGTFVFPLPQGAAVDQLTMYINGVPIEARILEAGEARGIYNEIVRQYRDPALLEYVGTQAIQANVFPIPPGENRRIELAYTQVLDVDNGLIQYIYPMDVTQLTTRRPIEDAIITVNVISNDPVSTIYSPSHDIAISREGEDRFRVGFERSFYRPEQDFSLFYGIASDTINVNLLTYRESATDDGFFMLLVQPPLTPPEDQIIPRDIIVVLDQSGSMSGPKWDQAREAASYVLDRLNPRDRFNVVLFSTGWRVFSNNMEDRDLAPQAVDWINGQFAEGGTDINGALTTAMQIADAERPTTILFLTDGLATEGVTETDGILRNIAEVARPNARIFTFGVGDDVDTFLLDALVRDYRGTGSYVRPNERIDEEVESLFSKISAPVLADVVLDFGDVAVDSLYPQQPLPDLFAGTQLTIVGRYRFGDDVNITLSGNVDGEAVNFIYDDMNFREVAGGEAFIARLWATRRIGELLNQIRLSGETDELVDSVISLSLRYGIITPYTSFLIEEDDILSQTARERAEDELAAIGGELAEAQSGARAVDAADAFAGLSAADAPLQMTMAPALAFGPPTPAPTASLPAGRPGSPPGASNMQPEATQPPVPPAAPPQSAQNPIQTVGDKTFILQNDVWTDTTFEPDTMTTTEVVFLSDAYFELLADIPQLSEYFAIGDRVIVVYEGTAYEVVTE